MSIKIGIGRIRIGWSSTPVVQELVLTFDDIANASGMIGGDAISLADWNIAFDSPAIPFTSIEVVGNVINLKGGSNIAVPDSLFSTDWDYYGHLISIVDNLGVITSVGYNSFGDYDQNYNGNILETVMLPALVTAGEGCFYNYVGAVGITRMNFDSLVTADEECFDSAFWKSPIVGNQDFPSLVTAGRYCFTYCEHLINPDFSSLTSAGFGCFTWCTSFVTMSFPSLIAADISLGTTTGDDTVFFGITGKVITLTIPAYFMTNNGGNPDGDILYLDANNTLTVIQV